MVRIFLPVLACLLLASCFELPTVVSPGTGERPAFRVMFWNPENLFDCQDDTARMDDEFLPYGIRAWNYTRYQKKIRNTFKVIIAAGEWNPPDLVGLCEVENSKVLFDLLRNSAFVYYNYRFIHFDSPDHRGIDVALLYNPARVEIISERQIPVKLSSSRGSATRDILFARARLGNDTLSVFVNHWPSKYGGAGITMDFRRQVSKILAAEIRNAENRYPGEKIIVMGDFNDTPESSALIYLEESIIRADDSLPLLCNLSLNYRGEIPGSYKFQGSWEMIDQVMVSKSLISPVSGLSAREESFRVFSPDFLLENDEKYGGVKPSRTYSGLVYSGGYSDHLPVILDLYDCP